MFEKLLALIFKYSGDYFFDAAKKLDDFISSTDDFMGLLSQIGTIPEIIPHDSTEEKLFSKASDAVLSRAFRELGLKSTVIPERADSADVIAQSYIFDYTLVADAKAFRLSRTAKNQKDFKVGALSSWRKDNDYAVLCSPYFHYPRSQSQIYAQATNSNVCLLSWEHLHFLLDHGVKENNTINLSALWNFGEFHSRAIVVSESKKCFLNEFNASLLSSVGQTEEEFRDALAAYVKSIIRRGEIEKAYWESERRVIEAFTREQAITELVKSKKLDEKIHQIDAYIRGISRG